ncbi:hypothetical protein KR084_004937 [Drosophila pseudotakahashii]|nr:hypothetical protein KR084_004937 [Drosophila pseudotakahashii]
MERYWTIGALLLGCVLMGNACNYDCALQENCQEQAPIFDYRSRNCTHPQICCAVIRQNLFTPPPPLYPTRQNAPRPHDQTVSGGIPATQWSNGGGSIQPIGRADNFAGPNGNPVNQKPTYGGGIPASQWSNGVGSIQSNGPADNFEGPNGNPVNQKPTYGNGIPATQWSNGAGAIQPNGPAGPNGNPVYQKPTYGGGIPATQWSNGVGSIQSNGPADNFEGPNGNPVNQKPTYGKIPATQWSNGAGTIQPNGPADHFTGPNGNGGGNPPVSATGIGHRPNVPNGNTIVATGRPPITGGNPPFSTTGSAGNINNPTILGGNSQPSKTNGVRQNQEQGEQCGLSNANGLQFFNNITEDQALPGQYPWSVALIYNGEYLAGGSLIKPGVVLTAAHRLVSVSPTDLLVWAGDWDLASTREQFKAEHHEVERIQIHEKFHFSSGANNLALLFLKSEFQLSDNIRTICLPEARKSFEGRRCIVAGWGKIKFHDESHSTILKKVELPMVGKKICQQQLQQTILGFQYQLPESMICAGGVIDRDACSGDGGSALFCSIGGENSGLFEQAGVVNFGIECGQKDVPGTYTDVAMFRHWIDEQLLPFRYRMGAGPPY